MPGSAEGGLGGLEGLMAEEVVREWTRLLGSSSDDYPASISTAADGSIYIAGNTYGSFDEEKNTGGIDSFVSKYNGDGLKEWTQFIGPPGSTEDDQARSIAISSNGSVYISGSAGGSLNGNDIPGYSDAFIAKYNVRVQGS